MAQQAQQIWVETQDSGLVRADVLIQLGVVDGAGSQVTRTGPSTAGTFDLEAGLSSGERVVLGSFGGPAVFDAMAEFVTLLSSLVGTDRSSIVSLQVDQKANTWQWNIS